MTAWRVVKGLDREKQKVGSTKGHKETFGVTDILIMLSMMMAAYVKTCKTVHFKYTQIILLSFIP